MNVNEAILNLNALYKCLEKDTDEKFLEGLKLGILALKRLKESREGSIDFMLEELPGETE